MPLQVVRDISWRCAYRISGPPLLVSHVVGILEVINAQQHAAFAISGIDVVFWHQASTLAALPRELTARSRSAIAMAAAQTIAGASSDLPPAGASNVAIDQTLLPTFLTKREGYDLEPFRERLARETSNA